MSRRVHRFLWGAALLALIPPGGHAQDLTSNQEWSQVAIQGEVSVSGTMPLSLRELPPGTYRITARGFGFPETRARLLRGADGALRLSRLHGPESLLLPPGAVHLREPKDRWRGILLLSVAAFSGVQGMNENGDVGRTSDNLALAQQTYDDAVTEDEIREARVDLTVLSQEVSDREEMRTLWLGATGYLWLGAALESWLLTPSPSLERVTGGYRLTGATVSGARAALHSAVLPGGGQRYVGETSRGNLYLAGVSLFGIGALVAQDRYLEKSRDQLRLQEAFNLATDPDEIDDLRDSLRRAQDDARDADVVRWTLVGLTAGTYLWNILDAATQDGARAGDAQGMSLQLAPHGEGVRAQVNWRID